MTTVQNIFDHCLQKAKLTKSAGHQTQQPTMDTRQVAAQRILRRFFFRYIRPCGSKAVASRFLRDCMGIEEAKSISFQDLSAKLRSAKTLDAGGDMLLRMLQICNWGHKEQPWITGTVNVKIFLAAYMIVAKPSQVFESIEDLEQKLMDATSPMLESVHATAQALSEGKGWAELAPRVLCTNLITYLRSFKSWKIVDERKLAGRLQHALDELSRTKALLSQDDIAMHNETDAQIKRLTHKLHQIVPPEVSSGKKRKASSPTEDNLLSAAAGVDKSSAAPGNSEADAITMTNEQLAHELLLDPSFQIAYDASSGTESGVRARMREVFERSFWLTVCDDLMAVPCSYTRVLSVLQEISKGVQDTSKVQKMYPLHMQNGFACL